MRIVRFLSHMGGVGGEGQPVLGQECGDGMACVLLDAAGVLGPAQTQQATRAVLRGKRAVVADDDDGILQTVEAALSRFDCSCHICHDGDEALDAIEHEPVDLVVSDIVMPGHDGYEVFAAAKQRDPDLPVVLITGFGYDPSHTLVRASQQGLEAVLFKPFTPRQLVDRVTEAMIHHEALVPTDQKIPLGAPLAPLTPRDVVCAYPATGNGQGGHLELFLKPSTAIQDPGKPVRLPQGGGAAQGGVGGGGGLLVDCRGRLAVVLASKISRATPEEALRAVLGYTVANDITARRPSGNGSPAWLGGKGFDTFCPLGPAIITPEQTQQSIRVRTKVNGREVASSDIPDVRQFVGNLLSQLSQQMTLAPGTVILTGPAEVAAAEFALKPGDVVRVEAEGIGALENRISSP